MTFEQNIVMLSLPKYNYCGNFSLLNKHVLHALKKKKKKYKVGEPTGKKYTKNQTTKE
jgi:hypothetical protein